MLSKKFIKLSGCCKVVLLASELVLGQVSAILKEVIAGVQGMMFKIVIATPLLERNTRLFKELFHINKH